MDFLTFLSNAIHDLAWPGLTLFILFQAKKNGAALAEFIELIRYKDFEIVLRQKQFDRARETAHEVAKEVPPSAPEPSNPPLPPETPPGNPPGAASNQTSSISPEFAILETWRHVEADLWAAYDTGNVDPLISYRKIAKELHSDGKISSADFALYEQLNAIRNRVVHYSGKAPVTPAEILEFQNLAGVLRKRLQSLKAK